MLNIIYKHLHISLLSRIHLMIFFAHGSNRLVNLNPKSFRSKSEYYEKVMEHKFGYIPVKKSNDSFVKDWKDRLQAIRLKSNTRYSLHSPNTPKSL